jgi:hypothetical protein
LGKDDKLSRWILFGFLSIPLPLLTYFYLVLHVGLHVPLRAIALPALIFSASLPILAAGTYWGTRARARGNSVILFFFLGLFVLLCGFEFSYFDNKLGFASKATNEYEFALVWAVIVTVGGYLLVKSIGRRDGNSRRQSGRP